MKRVGLVSFMHESNTFNPVLTNRKMFKETCLAFGKGILSHWEETHHEIGGILKELPCLDLESVPLITASAMPSGPIQQETYEEILDQILERISSESLDGLLVCLHGAMVAQHIRDADGWTASKIRTLVGKDLPIVLTLDLHANVSPLMIESVTATTIYRTYPHLDQRERGQEAARMLGWTLEGKVSPAQALIKPPMLISILAQETSREPMAGLYRKMEAVIQQEGILSASIAPGFAYADVEEMGPAFLVVADGDKALAHREALALAQQTWDLRHELTRRGTPISDSIRKAMENNSGPVTLFDVGDNVGGGSPGDGTLILQKLLHEDAKDALVVLYDPAAVKACVAAGAGAIISLNVGGKSDVLHGPPVPVRGQIRCLHDGTFVEENPRHGGTRYNNQGLTALIETPKGHTIVLTSLRMAPFSLEQVLSLGIKPERMRILVAKGAIAPMAAYRPISNQLVYVDTPGITSANPFHFNYQYRPRPLFPFEKDIVWKSKSL